MSEALERLIAAVAAGNYLVSRSSGDAIAALDPKRHGLSEEDLAAHVGDAAHGSLDAAKALHDALLPCWRFSVRDTHAEVWDRPRRVFLGEATDEPARSWLLAILRAYADSEKERAENRSFHTHSTPL